MMKKTTMRNISISVFVPFLFRFRRRGGEVHPLLDVWKFMKSDGRRRRREDIECMDALNVFDDYFSFRSDRSNCCRNNSCSSNSYMTSRSNFSTVRESSPVNRINSWSSSSRGYSWSSNSNSSRDSSSSSRGYSWSSNSNSNRGSSSGNSSSISNSSRGNNSSSSRGYSWSSNSSRGNSSSSNSNSSRGSSSSRGNSSSSNSSRGNSSSSNSNSSRGSSSSRGNSSRGSNSSSSCNRGYSWSSNSSRGNSSSSNSSRGSNSSSGCNRGYSWSSNSSRGNSSSSNSNSSRGNSCLLKLNFNGIFPQRIESFRNSVSIFSFPFSSQFVWFSTSKATGVIPYLARPFLDINNPRQTSLPAWMSSEQQRYSEILFAKPIAAHPVLVAQTIHNLPMTGIPQVAVVGKSNVGKSSLINALMFGKEIARTSQTPVSNSDLLKMPTFAPVSNTPVGAVGVAVRCFHILDGRTRHLFTFDLADHLSLVDLPGYGIAKVTRELRNEWAILIEEYFNRARNLKRIISLVEATKGATDLDHKLWDLLIEKKIRFQIVLTKVDLLEASHLHSVLLRMLATLQDIDPSRELYWPFLHALSSRYHLGIHELRCSLSAVASDDRKAKGKKLMRSNELPERKHR